MASVSTVVKVTVQGDGPPRGTPPAAEERSHPEASWCCAERRHAPSVRLSGHNHPAGLRECKGRRRLGSKSSTIRGKLCCRLGPRQPGSVLQEPPVRPMWPLTGEHRPLYRQCCQQLTCGRPVTRHQGCMPTRAGPAHPQWAQEAG